MVWSVYSSIEDKFKQEHGITSEKPFPYEGKKVEKKAEEILNRPENVAELYKVLEADLVEFRKAEERNRQETEVRFKEIEQINELARLLLPDRLLDLSDGESQIDLNELDFEMESKGIDSLGWTFENLLDTWSLEEIKEEYQEHIVELTVKYRSNLLISVKFTLDPDLDYGNMTKFGPTSLFWRNDRWTKIEISQTDDLNRDLRTTVLLTYFAILNRTENPMERELCYNPIRFCQFSDDQEDNNWLKRLLSRLEFSAEEAEDYFNKYSQWQESPEEDELNFGSYYQYVISHPEKRIDQLLTWPSDKKIFYQQCLVCEEDYQLVFSCGHVTCIPCYKRLIKKRCPCCRLKLTDKVYRKNSDS